MPAIRDDSKEHLHVRVPRRVMDEVRKIAAREQESQALVIRRLLRDGVERLELSDGDAA